MIEPINTPRPLDSDTIRRDDLVRFRQQATELGLVVLRIPGIDQGDYALVRTLMESYYGQELSHLRPDIRVADHRQVGLTEPHLEHDPRHKELATSLPEHLRPFPHKGPNPFMRFFWRYGSRPVDTDFPERHADPVIPKRFRNVWATIMNDWGEKISRAGIICARMTEKAFELENRAIQNIMHQGPHLVAPTGCDLITLLAERSQVGGGTIGMMIKTTKDDAALQTLAWRHNWIGLVLSDWHTDFNLFTGHGPSNFPGLLGWTPALDKAFPVRVPPGCFLFQFGEGMEYLSAGKLGEDRIRRGYHQVVVTMDTLRTLKQRLLLGLPPIRVSSTAFFHGNSDQRLAPLPQFRTGDWERRYPPTTFGAYGAEVIKQIGLGASVAS
jgi:hypothetical protein